MEGTDTEVKWIRDENKHTHAGGPFTLGRQLACGNSKALSHPHHTATHASCSQPLQAPPRPLASLWPTTPTRCAATCSRTRPSACAGGAGVGRASGGLVGRQVAGRWGRQMEECILVDAPGAGVGWPRLRCHQPEPAGGCCAAAPQWNRPPPAHPPPTPPTPPHPTPTHTTPTPTTHTPSNHFTPPHTHTTHTPPHRQPSHHGDQPRGPGLPAAAQPGARVACIVERQGWLCCMHASVVHVSTSLAADALIHA